MRLSSDVDIHGVIPPEDQNDDNPVGDNILVVGEIFRRSRERDRMSSWL